MWSNTKMVIHEKGFKTIFTFICVYTGRRLRDLLILHNRSVRSVFDMYILTNPCEWAEYDTRLIFFSAAINRFEFRVFHLDQLS